MESELASLENRRKQLQSNIPANWENAHKDFRALLSADRRNRLLYRRGVDSAYEPVLAAVQTLGATPELAASRSDIEGLRGIIEKEKPEQAVEAISAVSSKLATMPGTDAIRSELSAVRRALTRNPDKAAALKALESAVKAYDSELAWREKASQAVLPGLRAYNLAIRDTIGLRKQEKLPQDLVPTIAACTAHHRDISLQF